MLALLLVLQYRLWFGEGSVVETQRLKQQITLQAQANQDQLIENSRLAGEVAALKHGTKELEARAREDLGLIKAGETFYLLVDEHNSAGQTVDSGRD